MPAESPSSSSAPTPLAAFLRARRALVRPEDVGLTGSARRRLPGLRREEVAALAGISAAYYLRLERGRDRHPSPEVADALADVLRLDADARAHLRALALGRPRHPAPHAPETVPEPVRRLVLSRRDTPAYVQGRYHDVLVANPLATALSPSYRPGVNLLRAVFLDETPRPLYEDWESVIAALVASLRVRDAPGLAPLVAELREKSDDFRRLWARHDVSPRTAGRTRLLHPDLGPLDLAYEKLTVLPDEGQVLVVYHAERGSRTAGLLASLGERLGRPPPSPLSSAPAATPSPPGRRA
ncbi:helix-turn-helix domain-containing protein [Streptomyces evansiae]|uniref:helix-turn-helix domain-containing protein n=1 Tax=Streptomyces evansiae TaxID=3075535 RepID=UPI0028849401|nr:helix-turn-helix domain-containing protein [Streptomyces sp. DSM 41859]MDT0425053.1 helix-turn-helix domain-containing protein [Streptomyces sp. DSM 41859]